MTEHEVRFERNTKTGRWRAFCTCGWMAVGERMHVQQAASTHDLEWVPVMPETDVVQA